MPGDPFASVLEDAPNAPPKDPFADVLEPSPLAPGDDGQRPSFTPDGLTPAAPALTTGQELKRDAIAYAKVPELALEQAVTQGGRGLAIAAHKFGLVGQDAVDYETQRAQQAQIDSEANLGAAPGANAAAGILGGIAAFAVNPALGVAQMTANKYQDAVDAGATPQQAAAAGLITGTGGAILGPVAAAAAPLVRPIANLAGREIAPIAAPMVEHGIQNAGGGAILNATNAAGTAVYDPEQAKRDRANLPADAATLSAVGLLTGALGHRGAPAPRPTPEVTRATPDPFAAVAEPVADSSAIQPIDTAALRQWVAQEQAKRTDATATQEMEPIPGPDPASVTTAVDPNAIGKAVADTRATQKADELARVPDELNARQKATADLAKQEQAVQQANAARADAKEGQAQQDAKRAELMTQVDRVQEEESGDLPAHQVDQALADIRAERARASARAQAARDQAATDANAAAEVQAEGEHARSSNATQEVEAGIESQRASGAMPMAPAIEGGARQAFRDQVSAGTARAEMRARIKGLLDGFGTVETVTHRNPTAQTAGQNELTFGNKAVGPNHHSARMGVSPFVQGFIDQHGAAALPSLRNAIKRAGDGYDITSRSRGEVYLLEHGFDGVRDPTGNPEEAPFHDHILGALNLHSGAEPDRGSPVAPATSEPVRGLVPRPVPLADSAKKPAPEPTQLDRLRAEEEQAAISSEAPHDAIAPEPTPTPDAVRGGDVGQADAVHPEAAIPETVPGGAAAPESIAPKALAPGDRVMVGLKGRPSEARIDAIHPDGRMRVTTADGRTLPAVKADLVTRIPGGSPPPSAGKPAPVSGPNATKPVAVPRTKAPAVARVAPKAPEVQPRLPTPIKADELRRQFDALPVNKRTPGLTDALMGIVDARAKSAGMSTDDWVSTHVARVQDSAKNPSLNQADLLQGERLNVPKGGTTFEPLAKQWRKATGDSTPVEGEAGWQRLREQTGEKPDTLNQEKPLGQAPGASAIRRGSVQFLQDGRAIIHAFEHADASTSLHELSHIFRRDLTGEDLAIAEREMGVRNGRWARGHEEKFARAFERWTRDGKAPTDALKGVFAKFATWLRNVYQSVKGSPIDVKVSPAMERLFGKLLTPDAMKSERTESAPAVEVKPSPEVIAERRAKLDAARGGPATPVIQKEPVSPDIKAPSSKKADGKVPTPELTKTPGPTATSNANAFSAETRKRLGVPERETPAGRSFDEMFDAGASKSAADPTAISSLVEELRRNPERIVSSNVEAGLLLKHKVDLENDLNRLRKEADDAHAAGDLNGEMAARVNLASQRDAVLEFTGLMERAGTAAGRALVARKMMATMDHSLSHMESDAAAAKGAPLTDAEAASIKTLHQEIQDAEDALHARLARLTEGYEKRIEDGDFTKKAKAPEPRDPETLRLRAKLEGAKRRWREKVREHEKSKRTAAQKVGGFVGNLPGQAKSLKASLDNSAVFRQGWRVMMTNPVIWSRNAARTFADAWKVLGGKNVMDEIHAEIEASPYHEEARRAKLAIISPEEDFPVSLPAMVPGLGRVFKASETAYTGFQYRNRLHIFEKMMEVAKRSGVDTTDTQQLRSIGEMINSLTSRGHLGKLEPVGNILNNVFFSARKIKADLNFLSFHATDTGFSWFARKQALYNLVKVASGMAMIMMIANAAKPGSVESDPRSADFGKIKVGNTRYDISGGASSMLVLAARMLTGKTKSSTSGKVRDLNDGKFGSQTRADVIASFFANKLSPVASTILNHLRGRTFNGTPPTLTTDARDLLMPMAIANFMELQQDTGATPESVTAGVLADFMGIGTNTYSGGKPKAVPK